MLLPLGRKILLIRKYVYYKYNNRHVLIEKDLGKKWFKEQPVYSNLTVQCRHIRSTIY